MILSVFADRIPPGERAQLLAHLPRDVREMGTPPRYLGRASRHPRTMHELLSNMFVETDAPLRHAKTIVEVVLRQLRQLVPEEAGDVAAVLPEELREMWMAADGLTAEVTLVPSEREVRRWSSLGDERIVIACRTNR